MSLLSANQIEAEVNAAMARIEVDLIDDRISDEMAADRIIAIHDWASDHFRALNDRKLITGGLQ